mmetsp:Transcript_55825/g.115255  ORF Transcript_55825/g.115255 Transcript_55825/m.115255 type:complete len:135 (-) Transcript_55825:310-714(-)
MSDSSAALLPRKPAGPRPGPPAPRRFGSTAKPSTATHGYSSSAVPPEKKPRQVTFSKCECEVQEYVPEALKEPQEEPEESGGLAALAQRRRLLLEEAKKIWPRASSPPDAGKWQHLRSKSPQATKPCSSERDPA